MLLKAFSHDVRLIPMMWTEAVSLFYSCEMPDRSTHGTETGLPCCCHPKQSFNWLRGDGGYLMGVATLSRSARKWLNVSSITWEGLQWAVSWPEPELQHQGTEIDIFSLTLHRPSLDKLKSLCECACIICVSVCLCVCDCERELVREIQPKAAGVSSWCSNHGSESRLMSNCTDVLTNHVHGLSWQLLWPQRTMMHLCGVLINHISLTQPQNSVIRVAPCLTY